MKNEARTYLVLVLGILMGVAAACIYYDGRWPETLVDAAWIGLTFGLGLGVAWVAFMGCAMLLFLLIVVLVAGAMLLLDRAVP